MGQIYSDEVGQYYSGANKDVARQLLHGLLGNGDDHEVVRASGLFGRNGGRSRFCSQRGERRRATRVGNRHLMPERSEVPCECAANVARTNDSDVHFESVWQR